MAIDFSEIYGTLKSRVRNPYFSSFIFSWSVINWKVPVGLSTLSKEELTVLGYTDWIHYIDAKLNWWNALVEPAFFGLLITSATPFIIAGYKVVKSRAEDWYSKDQKKNPAKRHIRLEKYLELWESYDAKLLQLQEAIDNAEVFKVEKDDLNKKINEYKSDISTLKETTASLEKVVRLSEIQIESLVSQLNKAKDTSMYPDWLNGKAFLRIQFLSNERLEGWVKIEKGKVHRINENGELVDFLVINLPRILDSESKVIICLMDVSRGLDTPYLYGVAQLNKNTQGAKGASGIIHTTRGSFRIDLNQELSDIE